MASKRARKPSSAKRSKGGGRRSSSGTAAVDRTPFAPAAAASSIEPDPAEDERGLTFKMRRFVDEVVANPTRPGTEAARKAYPDAKATTLASIASENLANPKIAAEIKRRLLPATIKADVSRDRVLQRVGEGMHWDPADAFNDDGSVKALRDMPPEVRRQIAGIDVEEIRIGEGGTVIGHVKKVRFLNRTENVQIGARINKMLVDKVEVQDATGRADRIRRARERSGK